MKHFIVPRIGAGTDDDPFRPNLPADAVWIGQPHTDATYLVAVPDDSPITPGQGRVPIPPQSLAAEAARRGLAHADVQRWRVGPPVTPPGQGGANPGQGQGQAQGNGRA